MSLKPLATFPKDFMWGTATSSHQVEGGQTNNDWVAAENKGGMVFQDQRSGLACDWWHRAEEDFDRMVELGLNTHRMSIEWSRVQPERNRWDKVAIARYREMLTGLIARGIQPMVTLHHFTNPLWVVAEGSWESEKILPLFNDYVKRMVAEFGDLVTYWCTINEPLVFASQGYLLGLWPPQTHDFNKLVKVAINMVRAHGQAYHLIHKLNPSAQVGLAKHMVVWNPRRPWLFVDHLISNLINKVCNHNFLDAVTQGIIRFPGRKRIQVPEALNTLDWLGVNYYQRYRIGLRLRSFITALVPWLNADWIYQGTKKGYQKGPGNWGEFHPAGLYESLAAASRYGVPLFITENGIPAENDQFRVEFLIQHLIQLGRAIRDGIPVKGYYHWSLVDNFEWAEAYNPLFQFGLYGVDRETQSRVKKTSASVYAEIVKQGEITSTIVEQFAPNLSEKFLKP